MLQTLEKEVCARIEKSNLNIIALLSSPVLNNRKGRSK
jgi:hypothetical protein